MGWVASLLGRRQGRGSGERFLGQGWSLSEVTEPGGARAQTWRDVVQPVGSCVLTAHCSQLRT